MSAVRQRIDVRSAARKMAAQGRMPPMTWRRAMSATSC